MDCPHGNAFSCTIDKRCLEAPSALFLHQESDGNIKYAYIFTAAGVRNCLYSGEKNKTMMVKLWLHAWEFLLGEKILILVLWDAQVSEQQFSSLPVLLARSYESIHLKLGNLTSPSLHAKSHLLPLILSSFIFRPTSQRRLMWFTGGVDCSSLSLFLWAQQRKYVSQNKKKEKKIKNLRRLMESWMKQSRSLPAFN